MSGLVAVFSEDSSKFLNTTRAMLNRIRHRGAGKRNVYERDGAILGLNHVKGEIIPTFENNGATVVADGNVLVDEGSSLEEVIAEGYEEGGEAFLDRLDGSFAFVISDEEKLMAARDPLGLKPLYYTKDDETMLFASEIKAFPEETADIRDFPPGHFFEEQKGFVRYYDTPEVNFNTRISPSKATTGVRNLLIGATEKHYSAARNSGVFLSGGVDSSVIAAICKEISEDIETFSVGVEGSADLQKARTVAEHIGSRHHEYIYDLTEMLQILPEVIYHLESFDMYLVRSAVANYMLSRMAKDKGMDAIYCGEGADEIFAGYQYLKDLEPERVNQELRGLISSSHKNCFQRVDRMLTAFSMEPRLPFADIDVTEYALDLPVQLKLHGENGDIVEKWVLRKAFEGDLPEEILWRKKQKFSEGAGSAHYLEEYAEEIITDEEYFRRREIHKDFVLRSKEELMYYDIFSEYFPHNSILDTIGRTRSD